MELRKSPTRSYSSPLRRRQEESTRRLIMEAVAALIAEGQIHSFSVQDVAARAGISYASVYRHFPTREKLLEAIYEWGNELLKSRMPPTPGTLEGIPGWVKQSIPIAEQYPAVNQAVAAVVAALNINPRSRRRRDMEIEKLVAQDVPNLPPESTRQAAAVIRYLGGSQAWLTLRRRFGLDPAETAEALHWALETLIRDLKQHRAGASLSLKKEDLQE